jgi:8-oxo-dGTP diphosphatase
MSLPLKWEFPGGKVELNETPENCLHRELKEELNIEVLILRHLNSIHYDYGTFRINLIPFISKYIEGEITLAEHKSFKWLVKEELISLDWAPADIPVLNDFLNITNL